MEAQSNSKVGGDPEAEPKQASENRRPINRGKCLKKGLRGVPPPSLIVIVIPVPPVPRPKRVR
eukprot:2728940-Prymnesium_polylepis.1